MTKRLFLILTVLALLTAAVGISYAQSPTVAGTPPQYAYAVQALSEYLGRPLVGTDVGQWSYSIEIFNDASLGCPLVASQPLTSPLQGFLFQIVVGVTAYDVRVSADGAIAFPCVSPSAQVTSAPTATAAPGVATPDPAAVSVTPGPCPAGFSGFLPPRLNIGAEARVPVGNTPNRIREVPSLSGRQIGVINPNTSARVTGGPNCDFSGGIIWWQINYNGVIGWTAEGVLPNDYFLDPVGNVTPPVATGINPGGDSPLPLERSAISSSNSFNLAVLATLPVADVRQIVFDANGSQLALVAGGVPQVFTLPDLAINDSISSAADVSAATAVTFLDASTLLVGYSDGTLARISTETGAITPLIEGAGGQVNALSQSRTPRDGNAQQYPSNRVAAAAGSPVADNQSHGAFVLDLNSGRRVVQVNALSSVSRAAYSPDGTLLAYIDNALHFIDVGANRELTNLALDGFTWGALDWRPVIDPGTVNADDILAYGGASVVSALNVRTMERRDFTLEDETMRPLAIAFSPNGSLLAVISTDATLERQASRPNSLALFDYDSGDVLFQIDSDGLYTMAFSPDGTLLAVSDGVEVTLWGVS